jgi:hypothetical protein
MPCAVSTPPASTPRSPATSSRQNKGEAPPARLGGARPDWRVDGPDYSSHGPSAPAISSLLSRRLLPTTGLLARNSPRSRDRWWDGLLSPTISGVVRGVEMWSNSRSRSWQPVRLLSSWKGSRSTGAAVCAVRSMQEFGRRKWEASCGESALPYRVRRAQLAGRKLFRDRAIAFITLIVDPSGWRACSELF